MALLVNGLKIGQFDPKHLQVDKKSRKVLSLIFKDELFTSFEERYGFDIPENYASHVGRPSLSELPYMSGEYDGMPWIEGHAGSCDGKLAYIGPGNNYKLMCWCYWVSDGRIGISKLEYRGY